MSTQENTSRLTGHSLPRLYIPVSIGTHDAWDRIQRKPGYPQTMETHLGFAAVRVRGTAPQGPFNHHCVLVSVNENASSEGRQVFAAAVPTLPTCLHFAMDQRVIAREWGQRLLSLTAPASRAVLRSFASVRSASTAYAARLLESRRTRLIFEFLSSRARGSAGLFCPPLIISIPRGASPAHDLRWHTQCARGSYMPGLTNNTRRPRSRSVNVCGAIGLHRRKGHPVSARKSTFRVYASMAVRSACAMTSAAACMHACMHIPPWLGI